MARIPRTFSLVRAEFMLRRVSGALKRLAAAGAQSVTVGALAATLLATPLARGQTSLNLPADDQTRTSAFTYFGNGLIKSETVEPNGSQDLVLTTEYTYDANGNRITTKTTGWNGTASIQRGSTADFSRLASNALNPAGLYATSITNGINGAGDNEQREYDPKWGGVTKLVGPNGVTTRWEYDEFGRKKYERRGYASATATTYLDYTQWDYIASSQTVQGATAAYAIVTQVFSSAGTKLAPKATLYYDTLNREIRSETESIKAGALTGVYMDTVYDSIGRVLKVSLPYFQSDTPQWTLYSYDDLGRKVSETAPTGLVTTASFTALRTTTTVYAATADGGPRSRTEVNNAIGRVIEVRDELGHSTYFVNDAKGNLTHTVDPYGNTTVMGYDLRGRKKTMSDPDMGAGWTYSYNAFGELIQQTDAKGQTTSLTYDDALGRLTKRTEPDLTTQFVYGNAAPNIGKLVQTYTDNGYCRAHTYDSLGRPWKTTVQTGGASPCTAPNDAALTTTVGYGSDGGRPETFTYPSGVVVKNGFNATLGFVEQVFNYTGGTMGAVYWTWQSNDALGRVTGFVYGNNVATLQAFDTAMGGLKTLKAGTGGGTTAANIQNAEYSYDGMNRLAQRADRFGIPNLVEKVVYDKLSRLTQYGLYDSAGNTAIAAATTLTYDALGNILTKSDAGAYYYNASGSGSVRPHAVAAVRGMLNNDYAYDANGNMLSGGGRTMAYTSFNMLNQVSSELACHKFIYQGDHQRLSQTIYNQPCLGLTVSSAAVSATLYMHPDAANGMSFERETRGSSKLFKHYVSAGGSVVAVLTTSSLTGNTNASGTVNYLHYDHLGSVVAVTDSSGAVIERRSFDPWGRPRNTTGTPGTGELPNGVASATDRGFTMHEHLENVGLIHMNGRVYDPLLARFTSADPMIQSPGSSQSYNRYSYTWNNPLNGTDLTGYCWGGFIGCALRDTWKEVWGSTAGRIAVTVAVAYFTGNWVEGVLKASGEAAFVQAGSLTSLGNAAVGAAGGFAGGFVGSNGRLQEGLKGAVTGAAFGYVGGFGNSVDRALGHAAVGCASAVMGGGKCGPGAVSALVAHVTTTTLTADIEDQFVKGVVVTVSGGITSKITGGSFENGALTAAYGYLFNYCTHSPECAITNKLEAAAEAVGDFFKSIPGRLASWAQENPVEAALTVASVTPAGPAIRTGMLVERVFVTAAGKVDFLAEAVVVGDRLVLRDAILYGRAEGALTGMTRDVYRGLGELRDWAAAQGFTTLEVLGTRVPGSTSANPGSAWRGVWDLTKKPGG